MKSWLLVICLVFTGVSLKAQDWIVINSGDTISCKIVSVDETLLHFVTPPDSSVTDIPLELVNSYEIYVPSKDSLFQPDPLADLENLNKPSGNKNKGLRINFCFGYTYMLAPIAEDSDQAINRYLKKSKSGININASILYFFGSYFGLGPKYSFVNLKGKSDVLSGFFGSYYYQHHIQMHYVGGQFCSRFATRNNGFRILPGLSLGYMAYKAQISENFFTGQPEYAYARTFGVSTSVSADIRLIRGLYFGFDFEVLISSIQDNSFVGENVAESNNLSRIDLDIGLRYYIQTEYQ